MKQEGSATLGENLNIYRDVKKNTFNNLSDVDKARWRVLAEEHNEKIMAPPSADYIFEYVLLSVVIYLFIDFVVDSRKNSQTTLPQLY